jgi:hypothetical protein
MGTDAQEIPEGAVCLDYPLTKAYAMLHETYKEMLNGCFYK